jgi:hypothetical protein
MDRDTLQAATTMDLADTANRAAGPFPTVALDGPMLIFGGCYGNLEATRAL